MVVGYEKPWRGIESTKYTKAEVLLGDFEQSATSTVFTVWRIRLWRKGNEGNEARVLGR